jgi:pimeloyl-ACP methyl ester carboxylesterase
MERVLIDDPRNFFVDANGIQLACQDWGGDGRPILILHATGFIGRVYRPIALALRSIGHVYSYDQRGHGDSSRPADCDYNWASTGDLKAFIAAMKLEGAHALGHSAGATVIGSLAAAEPALISRSVLVEPMVFDDELPDSAQDSLHERTLKRKRWFESADAMYRNLENKLHARERVSGPVDDSQKQRAFVADIGPKERFDGEQDRGQVSGANG